MENSLTNITATKSIVYLKNNEIKRFKVLIVDDEEDLCMLLKNYLTRKNFEVFIAHTLKEGLLVLNEIRPDILFLDNNLPDGTGWDKASDLSVLYPHLRINLISAFHPSLPDGNNHNINIIDKPVSLKQIDKFVSTIS
ncbi:response regulator [Chitinophagaceae bacterium 26-R-25]|nr:response regulator [Chitinophagaceae bacterium 26-R-25]